MDMPAPNLAEAAVSARIPVNSHNEWDPLEEMIVGRLEGASFPPNHPVVTCNIPGLAARAEALVAGFRYPSLMIEPARRELDGFIALLQSLGVVVRRPDATDYRQRFGAPGWSSRGFCNACPRDSMLVIGDEIIETPMAWPCRYFETHSYRAMLKEYFRGGARWTSAPSPQLTDELFDPNFTLPEKGEPISLHSHGIRAGVRRRRFLPLRPRSSSSPARNVTNAMGIDWLRRHLGDGYRIHEIKSRCPNPMHIDTTMLPLGPGKMLINPEYINPDELPRHLEEMGHSRRAGARPDRGPHSENHLDVRQMAQHEHSDDRREARDRRSASQATVMAMEKWGLEPIPCAFLHYAAFGGAFHCATLDVRRRGRLESYLHANHTTAKMRWDCLIR